MAPDSGFPIAGDAPARYEQYVALIMRPFVAALLDAAELPPGGSLLDVACGTGFVARAAAEQGGGGRIAGVDVSAGMLATAAERARAQGYAIEWREAGADLLPYGDGAFDAVVCQQGMQFFPDRAAAVAEAARVTAAGGRVAATVWAVPRERSPYFGAQGHAFDSLGEAEVSRRYAVAFSCGPEDLAADFRAAGLREVAVSEVIAEIRLPRLTDFVPAFLSATPWGQSLIENRPQGLRPVCDEIRGLLAPYTTADGSATVSFTSNLVAGVRR